MHPELSPPCIYTTFITILPKLKTGRNSNDVELLLIKNIAVSVDRTRNIQIFSLTLSQLTYPRNLLLVWIIFTYRFRSYFENHLKVYYRDVS